MENEKREFRQENVKPHFMQRLAGGIIDICLILLSFWGLHTLLLKTPIANSFNSYRHDALVILDNYKLESGYGEKIYITDENKRELEDYLSYEEKVDNETKTYVVKEKGNATKEEYESYTTMVKESDEYKSANFNMRLMNYLIILLSGGVVEILFLFIIPLLNKRRATLGEIFSEQGLFSIKYEEYARWYHLLIRFLFIFIFESALPYLFLDIYSFIVMPVLFLIIASIGSKGRNLHDLISRTMKIDKKSYAPLVPEDV